MAREGLLPTPEQPPPQQASRWLPEDAPRTMRDAGPEREAMEFQAMKDELLDRDEFLPTPTASDATKGTDSNTKRQGGPSLTQAVQLLPTATAGDAKASGSRNYSKQGKSKAHAGTSLTDAIVGDNGDPSTPGRRGKLNPTWVVWFMGGPLGWTWPGPRAETDSR